MLLTALLSEPVSENGAFHAGVFDFPPGRNQATPHGREGGWGGGQRDDRDGGERDSYYVRSRGHQMEGGGGEGGGGMLPPELLRKLAVDSHVHQTLVKPRGFVDDDAVAYEDWGEGGGGKEGESQKAKAMLRFFADTALGTPKPYLTPCA
jgi:hypothetical protein